MNRIRLNLLVSIVCCAGGISTANAQSNWVDFVDEPDRIDASIYIDNQEKDIAVGDVDNDGDDDLVIVRKKPFSVDGPRYNLLLINENGNLVDRTDEFIPTFLSDVDNARDVQLFDSDNNGWLDIIVANTFGSYHRLYINQGMDTKGNWLGYEDQGSNNGDWYSPPLPMIPQCCGIAIGDVNGDDFPDFFTVDYLNDLEARLFINNQDNTYTDESLTRLTSAFRNQSFGTTAFIADMNGDGHNDIVSNDALGGPGVEIAFNDGTGHFNQVQLMPTVASYMVERADFNADNRLDMYVVDDLQDYVLFNDSTNPDGTINVTQVFVTDSPFTQNFNGNIRPADVDQDGWMDIAVCDVDVDIAGCDRTFCLLRNNQGSFLSDPNNTNPQSWNVNGSHDMAWIDINCDGELDMFIAVCSNWQDEEDEATEPGYHMFVNSAPILLGDVNRDGVVSLLDVQPFVDILSSGGCNAQSDINQDGVTNLLDVAGFVDLLSD